MIKVANSEELEQLLNRLSQDYKIAAPVVKRKGRKERIEYEYIDSPGEITLERQPDSSPKKFFLPQNERMEVEVAGAPGTEDKQKTILFGVRSCDLEALKVLDDVFLDDNYIDAYYQQHRENIIIIGLSCSEGKPSCFCGTLGIDPVKNDSAPIFLYQRGDRYYFKVYDEEYAYLLEDLPEGDEGELAEIVEERAASFAENNFTLDLPVPLPEETTFSAPFWGDLAEKCLGCGVCTYYCPTCYCFGFFWEQGEKSRCWDSCMFASFTKHASGHNPRRSQDQRYRQRVMHKYSYHPENYGRLACTGCGRCLDNCPVNLDIRSVLKTVESYLQEKGGVKSG
ncbi:MAG: hypothetical protein PWR10_2042 [Halanaerobiales bacterium]|nr:hypothetical protein [Halanaerobiales bacterium]